jgi:hypothetical protein
MWYLWIEGEEAWYLRKEGKKELYLRKEWSIIVLEPNESRRWHGRHRNGHNNAYKNAGDLSLSWPIGAQL